MESLLASHNVMKLLSHGSSDADKLLDELITTLFNSQTTIDFTVQTPNLGNIIEKLMFGITRDPVLDQVENRAARALSVC